MPELPEVETVRRVLAPQLDGRRIAELLLPRPDVIAHPTPAVFRHAVQGAVFAAPERRGKYLLLPLQTGATIVVHLRMTGQLLVTPTADSFAAHTHVVFRLDGGEDLRFIDTRRFGRLWLLDAGEVDTVTGMAKLGPEPFAARFQAAYLKETIGARRQPIKAALLDQTVVAGIGNIYADEALYEARIHPARPAATLTAAEWDRLAAAIPVVLERAIRENDMTAAEYRDGEGKRYRDGYFQVYGREGDACPRCGATLVRIRIAGRSSVFCPDCQRET